ncbi:MAG TPA: ABC transporter substrate-binding protein [Thermoplasmata archaeon]|nr:ABC transporter substrate-binding protein [Thermoplasmata archaeon]
MRIVSLLPSATEIVYALGRGPALVGRSADCDFPREVRSLPVVMRPRSELLADSSAAIDREVLALRSSGASLYDLDVDLLRQLRPDVVLTQELCGVCSVTPQEVDRACRLAAVSPRIVSLTPVSLEGILESIRIVGAAIDAPSQSTRVVGTLAERGVRVRNAAPHEARAVAVLEWIDPPILAGLWTPEMIAAAGGRSVGGAAPGLPGVRTTWAALARESPEILVVSPCSFSVDRTRQELGTERSAAARSMLSESHTWIADEAYFSRPGPRLWDGLELLGALVRGEDPSSPYPVHEWAPAAAEVAT